MKGQWKGRQEGRRKVEVGVIIQTKSIRQRHHGRALSVLQYVMFMYSQNIHTHT